MWMFGEGPCVVGAFNDPKALQTQSKSLLAHLRSCQGRTDRTMYAARRPVSWPRRPHAPVLSSASRPDWPSGGDARWKLTCGHDMGTPPWLLLRTRDQTRLQGRAASRGSQPGNLRAVLHPRLSVRRPRCALHLLRRRAPWDNTLQN